MTGRRAAYWALLAVTLAVYGGMLGWSLPAIMRDAGGLMPFDLRPGGYTEEEARAFLAALGAEGRGLYLGAQQWLDLAYPALLAAVLIGAAWMLIRPFWLRLAVILLALGGMTADYLENARVAEMLRHDGSVPAELIAAASRATVAKSALTGLAMLAVCAGLVGAAWRKWRRQ